MELEERLSGFGLRADAGPARERITRAALAARREARVWRWTWRAAAAVLVLALPVNSVLSRPLSVGGADGGRRAARAEALRGVVPCEVLRPRELLAQASGPRSDIPRRTRGELR